MKWKELSKHVEDEANAEYVPAGILEGILEAKVIIKCLERRLKVAESCLKTSELEIKELEAKNVD